MRADSLSELAKLVFATKRVGVILACVFWLLLNIAAQAGIASVSLTYGFEQDLSEAMLSTGNASTPDMQHFYPLGNGSIATGATEGYEDESFTAHQYGSMGPLFGYNSTTELPKAGRRFQQQDGLAFFNNVTNVTTYVFMDSSPGAVGSNSVSIFTERTINLTYACESHQVTSNGNGSTGYVEVANIGQIYFSLSLPNSTTFINNDNTTCPDSNTRCSVIEVLETSTTQPWYYRCNITLGTTQHDPKNLSFVSDSMALYTTGSIAEGGFSTSFSDDESVIQSAQVIPQSSLFGAIASGDKDVMGQTIALFSIGALAVAGTYNPSKFYQGQTPSQGQQLTVGHQYWFIGILFLILLFQLIFIIIVAVWANRVKVSENSHVAMSVLMRPIADKMDDIGHGRENKAFKRAKKRTMVKYESDPITGVWSFRMKN